MRDLFFFRATSYLRQGGLYVFTFVCVLLFVYLSSEYLKNWTTFSGVRCLISNSWLDFDGDPKNGAEPEICNEIFTVAGRSCNFTNFADNSRSCQRILMIYLRGVDVSLAKINHSILVLIRFAIRIQKF